MKHLFEQKHQQEKITAAKDRFKYRPFFVRMAALQNISKYARYLFHLFSVCTGFYFSYTIFFNMGFPQWLAAGLAGIILLLFETIKSFLLEDAFNGYYKKSSYLITALFAGAFLAGSIASSLSGAKQYHADSSRKITYLLQAHKHQADSLESLNAKRNQELRTELDTYKAQVSYMGKINIHNKTNRQVIANYDSRLTIAVADGRSAMLELKAQQAQAVAVAQAEQQFNGWVILVVAGINEVLILLAAWFIVFYDWMIVREEDIIDNFAPVQRIKLEDAQQLFTQWVLNKTSDHSVPLLNEKKQESAIGFKPQQQPKVLTTYEQTRKNVLNDIECGCKDYRTLCKRHKINPSQLKKIMNSIKK